VASSPACCAATCRSSCPGDLGIRFGGETRRWLLDRCLVIDDPLEHEAWNRSAGDRTVLLVTFVPTAA
jgi:hypothetical protein